MIEVPAGIANWCAAAMMHGRAIGLEEAATLLEDWLVRQRQDNQNIRLPWIEELTGELRRRAQVLNAQVEAQSRDLRETRPIRARDVLAGALRGALSALEK